MPVDRDHIVSVARSWIGTPWIHRGRIKGVGIDCAMFISGVYAEAGLIMPVEAEDYPPDWHLHRDDERFMGTVLDHADEIPLGDALPGDVVLCKFGRAYAHGGIVSASGWPHVIHAWQPAGMVLEGCWDRGKFEDRPVKAFRLRGGI